jgi:hypothetical protein
LLKVALNTIILTHPPSINTWIHTQS